MLLLTAREVRSWRNPAPAPELAGLQTACTDRVLAVVADVCADHGIGEAADDKISKNAGILSRR